MRLPAAVDALQNLFKCLVECSQYVKFCLLMETLLGVEPQNHNTQHEDQQKGLKDPSFIWAADLIEHSSAFLP
jgi:hypothetical protein